LNSSHHLPTVESLHAVFDAGTTRAYAEMARTRTKDLLRASQLCS
jgi:hypothetical protein